MKGLIKLVCAAFLMACLFTGCEKVSYDEYGCFIEADQALKAAKKNNQELMVMIIMPGDDDYSTFFVENVLKSDEFKTEILPNYAVLNMDFSQASFQKTVVDTNSDKASQKAAEKYSQTVQNNTKFASRLNASFTPCIYLLSADEYYLSEISENTGFSFEDISYKTFKSYMDDIADDVENLKGYINAAKKSSGQEKIKAIDNLYENTPVIYRPSLRSYIDQMVKLDSKDENGLLSKYLFAQADAKATEAYMNNDILSASNAYVEVCKNEMLSNSHKQQAYYMAAYILLMHNSTDYSTALSYLNSSIQADPESESVELIQNVADYLETLMAAQSEPDGAE